MLINKHIHKQRVTRVSVKAQTDVFMYAKKEQHVQIIAVSNEYTSKILPQDVSIRRLGPLFGL